MSAAACGPSRGSAPPGRRVQIVLTVVVLLALPSPVRRRCRWSAVAAGRGGDRRRARRAGRGPAAGARGGRGCAARWPATSATACWRRRHCPAIALASALVVARPCGHLPDRRADRGRHRAGCPGCCRWRCWRCWPWCCPASPAGGRARARRRGRSARPDWVRTQGVATAVVYGVMVLVASLPGALVLVVAGSRAPGAGRPDRRARAGRPAGRSRRWLTARTHCSAAACRSTATSAAQRRALLLSNDADFDRVDAVRASCDAILVGAATVRERQPAAAGALAGPPRRADGPRAGAVADQGHRDPAGASSTRAPTSSPPATPRSSSTARARAWPTPARAWGRSRPSSTAASRWRCARLSDDLAAARRASG